MREVVIVMFSNKKVAIGTENNAKVEAVIRAFAEWKMEFQTADVDSGVSAQPFSDEETLQGALHRAIEARKKNDADIGIGLEGGVISWNHQLWICNWGAMTNRKGQIWTAGGARIPLPEEMIEPLRSGIELGIVIDQYSGLKEVRSNQGTIGILTHGQIDRPTMFEQVCRLLVGQALYDYHRTNKG